MSLEEVLCHTECNTISFQLHISQVKRVPSNILMRSEEIHEGEKLPGTGHNRTGRHKRHATVVSAE